MDVFGLVVIYMCTHPLATSMNQIFTLHKGGGIQYLKAIWRKYSYFMRRDKNLIQPKGSLQYGFIIGN